jgi:hypothetical protein
MTKRAHKTPTPDAPPEVIDFIERVDKVAQQRNLEPFTVSRKLFGQGRTYQRLKDGQGVNALLWIDAQRELKRMEADPAYLPPEPRRIKSKPAPKPKAKIKGRAERHAVSA